MHKIPIFLSSDNNYAPYIATTIASVCNNTKSFVDFYILDGGIKHENREKICSLKEKFNNFSIEFINILPHVEKYKMVTKRFCSNTTYSRFFIAELKPEIDKALYSDVDVIFLGDIKEFYNCSLDKYIIGAIQAPYIDTSKMKINFSKEHVYFCAGNLLIDCKEWRKNKIINKLDAAYNKYCNILTALDQDILNKTFDNNYKVLSNKFCITEYHLDYCKDNSDIIVRHYGTSIKPWNVNPNISDEIYPNLSDFWYYAKMTAFYNDLINNVNKINTKDILMHIKVEKLFRTRSFYKQKQ